MEQVQAVLPQIIRANPELLKFALDLIKPRLAGRVLLLLLLLTAALFRIVLLSPVARLASRLDTRGVELRHAARCLGAYAPHVETLRDAPARCGGEVRRDSAGVVVVIVVIIATVKRAGWG
jgi:hypothetical protein